MLNELLKISEMVNGLIREAAQNSELKRALKFPSSISDAGIALGDPEIRYGSKAKSLRAFFEQPEIFALPREERFARCRQQFGKKVSGMYKAHDQVIGKT